MVIVSIHQPNYLPTKSYFDKIISSDIFVFLDNIQYEKNGFTNRNRIRNCDGWKWLTVPVKREDLSKKLVKDVEIDYSTDWAKKHWKTIKQQYGGHRDFKFYEPHLNGIYSWKWTNLADLNKHLIWLICRVNRVNTFFTSASKLDVSGNGSELLLKICKECQADTYLSGPSGKKYLDETAFKHNGVNIIYQDPPLNKEPLSIIDDLFGEKHD